MANQNAWGWAEDAKKALHSAEDMARKAGGSVNEHVAQGHVSVSGVEAVPSTLPVQSQPVEPAPSVPAPKSEDPDERPAGVMEEVEQKLLDELHALEAKLGLR